MESKEHGKQAEELLRKHFTHPTFNGEFDEYKKCYPTLIKSIEIAMEELVSLRVSEAVEAATDKLNIDIANQDVEIIHLNEQLEAKDKEIAELKSQLELFKI